MPFELYVFLWVLVCLYIAAAPFPLSNLNQPKRKKKGKPNADSQ